MTCPVSHYQTRRPALDAGLGYIRARLKKSQGPHQVRADEGEFSSGS